MALAQRTDVEESEGLVALEELEGWDFSCEDVDCVSVIYAIYIYAKLMQWRHLI